MSNDNAFKLDEMEFNIYYEGDEEPISRLDDDESSFKFCFEFLKDIQHIDAYEVGMTVIDFNRSYNPIPAKEWLEWCDREVIPKMRETGNYYDPIVEYPDVGWIDFTSFD